MLKAQLAAAQRERDAAAQQAQDLQRQVQSGGGVTHSTTTTLVQSGGGDGGEQLKLALLDKAVAQEMAADLEEEVEDLAERVRELELELDILRAEAKLGGGGGGGGSHGDDSAEGLAPATAEQVVESVAYKMLKLKSDQLTQALIKVHGQNQGLTAELQKAHGLLREAAAANASLSQTAEARANALSKAETDATQALQRADDNSSAEQMVEKLTEQNLALEDKVTTLSPRTHTHTYTKYVYFWVVRLSCVSGCAFLHGGEYVPLLSTLPKAISLIPPLSLISPRLLHFKSTTSKPPNTHNAMVRR